MTTTLPVTVETTRVSKHSSNSGRTYLHQYMYSLPVGLFCILPRVGRTRTRVTKARIPIPRDIVRQTVTSIKLG